MWEKLLLLLKNKLNLTEEEVKELEELEGEKVAPVEWEEKEESKGDEEEKEKGDEEVKEIEQLKEQIARMAELLGEQQKRATEVERKSKIAELGKGCKDPAVLEKLIDGVEDKDLADTMVKIREEKAYLFESIETEGYNPANATTDTMDGVEAAFYALNPDLLD